MSGNKARQIFKGLNMRYSNNEFDQWGELLNGYDYDNQAWVVNGFYVSCAHPESMACGCFGRKFAGVSFSHLALKPVGGM